MSACARVLSRCFITTSCIHNAIRLTAGNYYCNIFAPKALSKCQRYTLSNMNCSKQLKLNSQHWQFLQESKHSLMLVNLAHPSSSSASSSSQSRLSCECWLFIFAIFAISSVYNSTTLQLSLSSKPTAQSKPLLLANNQTLAFTHNITCVYSTVSYYYRNTSRPKQSQTSTTLMTSRGVAGGHGHLTQIQHCTIRYGGVFQIWFTCTIGHTAELSGSPTADTQNLLLSQWRGQTTCRLEKEWTKQIGQDAGVTTTEALTLA